MCNLYLNNVDNWEEVIEFAYNILPTYESNTSDGEEKNKSDVAINFDNKLIFTIYSDFSKSSNFDIRYQNEKYDLYSYDNVLSGFELFDKKKDIEEFALKIGFKKVLFSTMNVNILFENYDEYSLAFYNKEKEVLLEKLSKDFSAVKIKLESIEEQLKKNEEINVSLEIGIFVCEK